MAKLYTGNLKTVGRVELACGDVLYLAEDGIYHFADGSGQEDFGSIDPTMSWELFDQIVEFGGKFRKPKAKGGK